MKWFYKSLREYQRKKNISYTKAKNMLKKWELIQEEIKGKKVIIEPKELLKYLISKL